ncbi:hypothetical protein E2C01_039862 [Portunus trituberculatus]|uniref:Uncharacterized protein n=1 Tax=Portunus trituberculatus TaxID=210409 RepID=A0A5B7FM21_PORTR|nr:hypothetical protein [Portunus trituberculatus]
MNVTRVKRYYRTGPRGRYFGPGKREERELEPRGKFKILPTERDDTGTDGELREKSRADRSKHCFFQEI